MRRAAAGVLAAVLALATVAIGQAATAAPGPSQIETAEAALDGFQAALAAGDRDGALALLAPEVVIFEAGGAELSREEYAHHHLDSDMEFLAATTTERTDRRSGASGDLVWVLTRSRTSGTFRGSAVDSRSVETALLARAEDGWKIVHLHWSSRTAQK